MVDQKQNPESGRNQASDGASKSRSKPKGKGKGWFKRQKMMDKVLLALLPAFIGGIYFFGWRVAVMLLWVTLCGCITEYLMARRRGDPLTGACLVTCALFALSLPPTLPFWMATVGIVVALTFGKEFFGGFGRNVFNPAIVGRAFIYVCFPIEMTSRFTPAWKSGWGGFLHWGPKRFIGETNALTAATPMWFRRDYGFPDSFSLQEQISQLFFGNLGKAMTGADGLPHILAAGSVGEVSALLLIIGGIYLLWTKTANWRLVLSSFAGAAAACLLFRYGLGAEKVPPLLFTLFSGAMVYACFFMVTDPVSAPRDKTTQYIYGAFIGIMIVFFRWKAVFAGGVAFAILLGNAIAPSIEMYIKQYKKSRKKGAEKPPA
ncbi:MAG: RnfABCDGE type electron transport complex subunit D [Lentisphaeria bacterium]